MTIKKRKTDFPRLVADIGGTNARFALEESPQQLSSIRVLPCREHASLFAAVKQYAAELGCRLPKQIAIAIATPITGDLVQMTNHHWYFSIAELKTQLQAQTLQVVNDFTAQALSITTMENEHLLLLDGPQRPQHRPDAPCAVVGPGTGLGVSGLIPDGCGGMVALAGEGGHVSFAPGSHQEGRLLDYAARVFEGHVSAERLLQGEGLLLIYRFLAEEVGVPPRCTTPAEVTAGVAQQEPLCTAALSQYCAILGSFCADVVLTLGGVGGLYLGGGIVPRILDFLRASEFRTRFEAKGRFADYLRKVPAYVLMHPYPGLLGAAVSLEQAMEGRKIS